MSWTQSVTECNGEMKQLHPMRQTQGSIAHCYFWEGEDARSPVLSFSPHSTYSRWGSLLWQYLSCRGIRPPLNSGLMTYCHSQVSFQPQMHKYGESETTQIMMATVCHVTAERQVMQLSFVSYLHVVNVSCILFTRHKLAIVLSFLSTYF